MSQAVRWHTFLFFGFWAPVFYHSAQQVHTLSWGLLHSLVSVYMVVTKNNRGLLQVGSCRVSASKGFHVTPLHLLLESAHLCTDDRRPFI